jgi:hypothetical protein
MSGHADDVIARAATPEVGPEADRPVAASETPDSNPAQANDRSTDKCPQGGGER